MDIQFTLLDGFHRGWDSNRGFESRSLRHSLGMKGVMECHPRVTGLGSTDEYGAATQVAAAFCREGEISPLPANKL